MVDQGDHSFRRGRTRIRRPQRQAKRPRLKRNPLTLLRRVKSPPRAD